MDSDADPTQAPPDSGAVTRRSRIKSVGLAAGVLVIMLGIIWVGFVLVMLVVGLGPD